MLKLHFTLSLSGCVVSSMFLLPLLVLAGLKNAASVTQLSSAIVFPHTSSQLWDSKGLEGVISIPQLELGSKSTFR